VPTQPKTAYFLPKYQTQVTLRFSSARWRGRVPSSKHSRLVSVSRGGGGTAVRGSVSVIRAPSRTAIFAPPWASQLDPGPVNQLYDFYPAHRYPIFACLNRESVSYQSVLSAFVADCDFLPVTSPKLYGFCMAALEPLSFSPPGRSFPRLFSCEFLNLFGGHGHLLILFRKQRNYSRNKLVRLFSFGHRVMLAPSRS